MSFFDDLTKIVDKYAKIIGEGAERVVGKSQGFISIYQQKEKISKLYRNLGEYIYLNRKSLGENQIGEMLRELAAEHRILDELTEKSSPAPKEKTCDCGYKTKSTFEYCPKCGKKF